MHDILGYVFGWILDAAVPTMRRAWGNRGWLLASIVAAVVLVGLVPAYVLHQQQMLSPYPTQGPCSGLLQRGSESGLAR